MEQSIKKGTPNLILKNISKTFYFKDESVSVIKNISLDVYGNEFLVILGPGKCGKTTLLNIIAGLMEKTSGDVIFASEDDTNPGRLGFVFQRYALFPWKTVMENVESGMRFRGVPKKERREKAQYYIDLVNLTGFEKAYPKKLSGGMKQRVGIARAFANDTNILLMDEPFGALDAQTRYQMQDELCKIWSNKKKTIVFVTSNIEEALYLADRIVLLSAAPAVVKAEYEVKLARPRSLVSNEFLQLRKKIEDNTDLDL